jgi:Tol biopolymer transport system component
LAPKIRLDRLIPHFWRQKYLSTALLTLIASALPVAACGGNPPQIVDYGPARGAIDVSTAAPIRITFDHAVDQPSVESRIHLLPTTAGNVRWLTNRQLVYQHETLHPLTTYEVVIEPGYKDLAGNTYTLRHHWLFTTEGPPILAGSTPAIAEGGVDPAAYLTLAFSRTMNLASLKSAIVITPAAPFNVRLDPADNRRAIIAPSQLLTPNSTYDIGVYTAARDVDGNQLNRDYTINFKTGAIRTLHGWITFSTQSTFGSAGGLWIVNESGFPRQLVDTSGVSSFAWSPSGDSLLAQLDGKTWQRFAPGAGSTALSFKGFWAASLASGMGTVYIDNFGALRLQTADGRDELIADEVVEAAVTPNGLRLAYVHGATDPNQIWGYDVGLKASYLLASDSARVSNVTWAPSGNRIAYLRSEFGNVALRIRNLTGAAATSTAATGLDLGAPAWFPNSSHVVFAASVDAPSGVTHKAFVINALAPPATLSAASGLPAGAGIDVSSPTPSPDGHQIAFLNDKQVWLMNADGTRPTALTKRDAESFPYLCRALVWTRT